MEVVSDHDGDGWTECGAYTSDDFFIGLREAVGDHGSVQRKQDAVEFWRRFQAGKQSLCERFESVSGQRALGRGGCDVGWEDIELLGVGSIEVAGYFGVACSERSEQIGAGE